MQFNASILVMDNDGRILAVNHKKDKDEFVLPGGKVELGETPVEAAFRELLKETGHQATDPRYHIVYHTENDGKLSVVYQLNRESLKQVNTITEYTVAWMLPDHLVVHKTLGDSYRNLFKAIGIHLQNDRDYGYTASYAAYNPGDKKKQKI